MCYKYEDMAPSLFRLVARRAATRSPSRNALIGCGARISTKSVSENPSLRPYSTSPWLTLPPAFEGGDMFYKFYSLADKKIISISKRSGCGGGGGQVEEEQPDDDAQFVGSSHGWLALFNPRNSNLFLSNPLSRRHIKLPPLHTLKNGNAGVSQVIISSSPDEEDCRAMINYGKRKRLAFCSPGRSTVWTPIGDGDPELKDWTGYVYERFVYANAQKLFFCITLFYDIETWDLRDPKSPKMNPLAFESIEEGPYPLEIKESCKHFEFKFLVSLDHTNELLLVRRYVLEGVRLDGSPAAVDDIWNDRFRGTGDCVLFETCFPHKTIRFDVYKYDPDGLKFKYMDSSLDGLALFIGSNHAFALPTSTFPELKPNSIYFTDIEPMIQRTDRPCGRLHSGHDLGIYDYENRTFSPCYYPFDVQSIKTITPAPMWFTPNKY